MRTTRKYLLSFLLFAFVFGANAEVSAHVISLNRAASTADFKQVLKSDEGILFTSSFLNSNSITVILSLLTPSSENLSRSPAPAPDFVYDRQTFRFRAYSARCNEIELSLDICRIIFPFHSFW